MIFRRHGASGPLRGLVEYFWYHEGMDSAHSMERLLPDGAIELIVDLTDHPKCWVPHDHPQHPRAVTRSWVSGQHSRPILVEAAKQSCMIGARFFPGGARAMIPGPLSALNDAVIEMDAIWGASADELRERLLAAHSIEARFRIFESVLIARRTRGRTVDPAVQHALDTIRRAPAHTSMRDLAQELAMSQTKMSRLFQEQVGLTPKRLARIFRFQRLLRHLGAGTHAPLSAVAAAHGYFDQAHFIRDFSLLSGMRPTEYLGTTCEYLNFVPIP